MIPKQEIIHELPEEMIQHIQSFLSAKEAARTTILSKSWYNAWLTRTNLVFYARDISSPRLYNYSVSMELVEEILQRYERMNLKIRSFKLWPLPNYYIMEEICRAAELTKKAMKLGVTDVDIQISSGFVLPREVLLSESLVRLSMELGIIHLQDLTCWRLKSLTLRELRIQDDDDNNTLDIICRMCPLIEELVLSYLWNSSYDDIVLKPPGLIANDFHKLRVLSLEGVGIGEGLFPYLSSKFPCLKELNLKYCTGYEEIQICSDSLESVVLLEHFGSMMSRVEFDVPRIRRFQCELWTFVPSFSFKTTSREWESHITVQSSCFVMLRKFLLELSSSKIYLKIYLCLLNYGHRHDDAYEYASHMIGLPPIVERLELSSSAESALLEELFWSCRPNFIFVNKYCHVIIKSIFKTLIKEEGAMHDLEEVNVENPQHIAWTWSRNMCASEFPEWIDYDTDVCLQLKWGCINAAITCEDHKTYDQVGAKMNTASPDLYIGTMPLFLYSSD